MSLLSTFRRHVRAAGLASLLAMGSPVVSSPAMAQSAPASSVASAPVSRAQLLPPLSSPSELASAPHAYYIPAGAHAAGAFGSQWRLDMLLRNSAPIGTTPADIVLYAHPRGQAASPNDPSYAFALPAGASVWLPDVLGTITSDPLAAWVEARSTSPLSINEAYIHNLASTGDKTGSALPVFNAATLDSDQRLLREGDNVEFLLIGALRNARENNIIWNAPTSCAAVATPMLIDQLGNETAVGAPIQIPAGAYVQQTVDEAVGTTVSLGNVLRTTIRCEQGSTTPLQAWNGVTQINTLNPQYQDSIVLQGTKYPLADVTFSSPLDGEQNDPATFSARVNVPGGYVQAAWFNERGLPGRQDYGVNNETRANPLALQHQTVLPAAGTYTPNLHLQVRTADGTVIDREYNGPTYTVSAEKDGYVATKADVQAYVMNNLKEAGLLASRGTLDGKGYTGAEWEARWTGYFSATSPASGRLDRVVFNDVGDGLLRGGNIMVLYMEDGSYQADRSLPESYIDALRTKMKAKLP